LAPKSETASGSASTTGACPASAAPADMRIRVWFRRQAMDDLRTVHTPDA
jgi:hypothetical protein